MEGLKSLFPNRRASGRQRQDWSSCARAPKLMLWTTRSPGLPQRGAPWPLGVALCLGFLSCSSFLPEIPRRHLCWACVSVHPCVSLLAWHQHLSEPCNVWICLWSVARPASTSALGLKYAGVGGGFLNICEFSPKSDNEPNETKHRALRLFPAILFSGDALSLGWHMGRGTRDVFLSRGLWLNCPACKKCWKSTFD